LLLAVVSLVPAVVAMVAVLLLFRLPLPNP
jgi:hypothetical protein